MFRCQQPTECARRAKQWRLDASRYEEQAGAILETHLATPERELFLGLVEHAGQRQLLRAVGRRAIKEAFENGEVIHFVPRHRSGGARLTILGYTKMGRQKYRPLHLVVEFDPGNLASMWLITVYDPSLRPWAWDRGLRQRFCWCRPEKDDE